MQIIVDTGRNVSLNIQCWLMNAVLLKSPVNVGGRIPVEESHLVDD